jgi:hypothetical protein
MHARLKGGIASLGSVGLSEVNRSSMTRHPVYGVPRSRGALAQRRARFFDETRLQPITAATCPFADEDDDENEDDRSQTNRKRSTANRQPRTNEPTANR